MEYLNLIADTVGMPVYAVVIILIWTLIFKGIGLWMAAQRNSKTWFIILLIINSVGILPILYIFIFSRYQQKIIRDMEDNTSIT